MYGSVNCFASDVIINWWWATHTTWIKGLIIFQWRDRMRTTWGFSTELNRNPSIWFVESRNYVNSANRGRITHYGTVWEQKMITSRFYFFVHFPFCYKSPVLQHGVSLVIINTINIPKSAIMGLCLPGRRLFNVLILNFVIMHCSRTGYIATM